MALLKKDILKLINENISEMSMKFDSADRPHTDVTDKLKTGDTPMKNVPLPNTHEEPYSNFQELLASERYKEVLQKVRRYTGLNVTVNPQSGLRGLTPLLQMMYQAHNEIKQIESNHKDELIKLAIKLVEKELQVPEGSLQYDVNIENKISDDDFKHEVDPQNEMEAFDLESELSVELQNLDLEKAKRRLINAITQGASIKGYYMYHLVQDKLREITGSDRLMNLYGIMMSVNDLNYWQLGDDLIKQAEEDSKAGKMQVQFEDDQPKIKVSGVNFPTIVHELIKGVMEILSAHGLPEDPDVAREVIDSEDLITKELWDLRLGPAIYDRIRGIFPERVLTDENKMHIQNFLYMKIFKLPARDFLLFAKEAIGQTEQGKSMMENLVSAIEQELADNDYHEAMEQFESTLDDVDENTDNDDLKDFFGDLGISLSDDYDEDDDGEFV